MEQGDRLCVVELTQRILQMSDVGIYRESIFEVFQSFATKKDIRQAIAYAKTFGLYSVPSLRDSTLGTYYQLDPQTYQQRKHQVKDIAVREIKGRQQDAAQRSLAVNKDAIEDMLAIVRALMVLMLFLSASFWFSGQKYVASVSLFGAMGAALTWQLQRMFVQRYQLHKSNPSVEGQARSLRR